MCENSEMSVPLKGLSWGGPSCDCSEMTGGDQKGGGAIERRADPEN